MERADSCITRLNSVKFTNTKDGKLRIAKVRVPDMIRRIKYCSLTYKYPESYRDRSFELTAPGYLGELSYGFGDNDFYYSFNDSNDADSLTTSIVVYYDFDGSYKRFFLDQVDTKKQDAEIKYFGKRKMYLFKNWQKFFCGKLFLSRNTMVFYCTANEDKEKELQQAILTFKWE
ncbi:MAG TPA: hypothetical protein VK666_11980 [Chryseolinea sp.]|nr:hypothetical protein [Chryseolinea sp.]